MRASRVEGVGSGSVLRTSGWPGASRTMAVMVEGSGPTAGMAENDGIFEVGMAALFFLGGRASSAILHQFCTDFSNEFLIFL